MKKKWVKPNLIVLVRGKREERVLANCKKTDAGNVSNLGSNNQCAATGCTNCNDIVAS